MTTIPVERWDDRLKRVYPTIQAGKWPKRWIEEAKDQELEDLRRALLSEQPQAGAGQSAPDEREADASELQRVIYNADYNANRLLDADSFWRSEIAAIRVEFERYMRAAWQRAQSAPVVPDRCSIVPVEPTPAMVKAAAGAITTPDNLPPVADGWTMSDLAFRSRYQAALAAAPQPAARQEQGDEVRRLREALEKVATIHVIPPYYTPQASQLIMLKGIADHALEASAALTHSPKCEEE